MKGSSRRKTALELALKVGGYDEEEPDESKGRESTKRRECGGQFLIRCRERLDEGVHKTAVTTATITIDNSGNSNANIHVLSPMIRTRNTTFAIGRSQECMEPRASERDQETGR